MPSQIRVAIVGDYSPTFVPHLKTNEALEQMHAALAININSEWVPTAELDLDCDTRLSDYDAVWISPGSPYKSMRGALNAIRHSRETGLPLLGTCGGCQHVAIEFAHNVLGIVDAQHAESDPYASALIITPLSCSLKGLAMEVLIDPESRVAEIYGATRVAEEYYCNFGLNPEYEDKLHDAGLRIVGKDANGEARILTVREHPFFIATLFLPQLRSTRERPHPIIAAFAHAAKARYRTNSSIATRRSA